MAMEPEDTQYLPQPDVPLYSVPTIAMASFLGGPLAAGWLVSVNFRRLNEPKAARTALVIGILSMAALVALTAAVMVAQPADWSSSVPGYAISITYTAIIWVLTDRIQGPSLAAHFARGGLRHSPWRAVGVSLIAALPGLVVLVGLIQVIPMAPPYGFTGDQTPYGSERDVIFHSEGIPSTLIEEVGAALTEEGTLVNGRPDAVELRLDGDDYLLTVPVPLSSWSDRGKMKQLGRIEKRLAEMNTFRSVRIEMVHQGVSGIQRRSLDLEQDAPF